MVAYVPVIVMIVGVLAYALSTNAKIAEIGRLSFACGLLAVMFQFAGKMTRLLAFLLIPVLLSGCVSAYCRDAANHDTARCKAERVVLNCGEAAVIKVVKGIAQQVFGALMSQNFDNLLADIENRLKAEGQADAPGLILCAINEVTSKSSLSPSSVEERTVIQTHADIYRNAHKNVSVKAR